MSNWATTGGDFGGASTWQHRKICKTVSADGTIRCAASAEIGSDYCRHHDPSFERDAAGRIVGLKSAPKVVELPDVKRAIGLRGLPKSDVAERVEARAVAPEVETKPHPSRWADQMRARAYAETRPYDHVEHGKLVEEQPISTFDKMRTYRKQSPDGRTVVTKVRFNVVTRREVVMDREIMFEHFAHSYRLEAE